MSTLKSASSARAQVANALVKIEPGEAVLTTSFCCLDCGIVVSYSPVEHRYAGRDRAYAEGWFVTRETSTGSGSGAYWFCPECSKDRGFKARKETAQ